MPILAFGVMSGGGVAGHLWDFGSSFRRKRVLPVFSHTSLQFLLLPKLDSLDTDCHASLPSVDNQSFFEEPSMGMRAQGSTLILASGKKTQIFGNFAALHISHVRRNFI